jgi:hypothetical protein
MKKGKLVDTYDETNKPNSLLELPNNLLAVSVQNSLVINVWDMNSGMFLKELQGHTNEVYFLRLLKNGLKKKKKIFFYFFFV